MKKKIIIAVILCVILLTPIPRFLKDGGTVEYNAVLYSVRKVHSINGDGYNVGTEVRLLFWEVYSSVEYQP